MYSTDVREYFKQKKPSIFLFGPGSSLNLVDDCLQYLLVIVF